MRFFACFPFCPIVATLPSKLPSDNVSCHRALIHLRALFIDTCTSTDHTHAHTTAPQTGVASPPLRRASPAAQLPTYISSWKRSRWPHDLLFEEDLVDTQSRPSTIQLHPGELRRICWTLLEWYSVSLWALVKIHLHVYGQPGTRINRCFTRFKLLLRSSFTTNMIMSMISSTTYFHPAEETIRGWILRAHSFVKNQVQSDLPRLRRLGRSRLK